jgi:DNA-binding response OmpR family regulator
MSILYVGNDLALLKFLQETLDEKVIRCPPGDTCETCRSFIQRISYDLILLDENQKLTDFIRSSKKNADTRVVIYSNQTFADVASAIRA